MESRVGRFVYVVAATGLVAAICAFVLLPGKSVGVPILVAFVVVAFMSGLLPLRFLRSGGQQGFNFEGAVFVGMLFTLPTGWIPLIMVAASVFTHLLQRPMDVRKLMFNPGKTGVEMAAGSFVFTALAPINILPTDARSVVAAVAAAVTYEVVSAVVMAELFRVLNGTARRTTVADVATMSVATFLGNTCFGLILAAVSTVHTAYVLLSGIGLAALFLGYRGYAVALGDRRRAEALGEMTHLLLDLPSDDDVVEELVIRLAEMFGGERASVSVQTGNRVTHWASDNGNLTCTTVDDQRGSGLAATGMSLGRGGVAHLPDSEGTLSEALVAPIGRAFETLGTVTVSGRRGLEPWDESDAALLSAIANELAVALDNMALFQQVEEERARLEAESTKLNDILTAATDGIVSMRADGTIDSWNPGMANITGVAPEDAIGRPWYAVLRLKDGADRDLAPATDLLASHAATNQVGPSLSFQVMRVDGEWRRLQCTISPVRGPGGDERGVVLVARDVTAEREVDELKSDFIATVSHELRTPLTPLKGFLTTLQNAGEGLSPEQSETVFRSMSSQLSRLEALIADLLAVAELDRGQLDLHTGPVQLGQLVPHAVDSEAGSQRDRCTVEVADVVAQADSVAIVRIVRSLVSNALKHTQGGVRVLVGAEDEWTTISVVDEGPGIPQWDQQRIFGRFDRLGNHLQRTQGPGLGLTIARSLAQRMGGDIVLDSELGTGSTFTLRVPVARPRLVAQPEVSHSPGA